MIESLTSKPGVIAIRVGGHVGREDIDKCFELLIESFENRPKTNLYIEVASLSGFDTEALTTDIKRGLGLLDKLDRFGRVAIVSDHTWIRWASRLESALLPGISYRIYKLAERDQALAWVEGSTDLPYGHAVTIIPTTHADAIGIEIDGRLSAEEIARVAGEVNQMRRDRPLKAVLVHVRSISGFDPSIAADGEYLRMKLGLLKELDRYAVVGGPNWLETWLKLWQPLLHLELRHFPEDDENAAWEWVGALPLVDHPVPA
jgi:hypothetical protein